VSWFGSTPTSPSLDVLVVCTGNFTRSPYIVWELRRQLHDRLAIGSAGTAAVKSRSGADPRVLECLQEDGIDARALLRHRPRQVSKALVDKAELVVTASRENRGYVDSVAPGTTTRVYTLLELARLVQTTTPPRDGGIAELVRHLATHRTRDLLGDPSTDLDDPIGQAPEAYRSMIETVSTALDLIVPVLLATNDPDRAAELC
jgi:protein-tyrosine-phosphatase